VLAILFPAENVRKVWSRLGAPTAKRRAERRGGSVSAMAIRSPGMEGHRSPPPNAHPGVNLRSPTGSAKLHPSVLPGAQEAGKLGELERLLRWKVEHRFESRSSPLGLHAAFLFFVKDRESSLPHRPGPCKDSWQQQEAIPAGFNLQCWQKGIEKLGIKMTAAQSTTLFEHFDLDRDGSLSLEEFRMAMLPGREGRFPELGPSQARGRSGRGHHDGNLVLPKALPPSRGTLLPEIPGIPGVASHLASRKGHGSASHLASRKDIPPTPVLGWPSKYLRPRMTPKRESATWHSYQGAPEPSCLFQAAARAKSQLDSRKQETEWRRDYAKRKMTGMATWVGLH